jgi:hypothetical protein|tara:strand:+ start:2788 stop:3477 length:690 start_codon:yes stop_codon:yes gene_type:complete
VEKIKRNPAKIKTKYGNIPAPLKIPHRPKPAKPILATGERPDPRGQKRMSVDKRLTRKQELFVKELVSNDGLITYKEAAIRAGYPESSAHTRAYELTNQHRCPHVVAAIKSYRAELDAKFDVNYGRHVRDLQHIRDLALENGAYSAAVQAEYRRGQAQGDIYVNKSEIRHGSIDSMSKEEVLKALDDLRESYGANTIDVTPTEDAKRGGPLQTIEDSIEDAESVELNED